MKRLMCNLSLAVSKHREDGAQRGRLRRGVAIHHGRLTEGRRNRTAALRKAVLLIKGVAYLLATCVFLVSVTSVGRQIMSPKHVDIRMTCRA